MKATLTLADLVDFSVAVHGIHVNVVLCREMVRGEWLRRGVAGRETFEMPVSRRGQSFENPSARIILG